MAVLDEPVKLLSDGVLAKIRQMTYWDAIRYDYERPCDWNHGLTDEWGHLPRLEARRAVLYRAEPDKWGYCHHQQLCYGLGRYFAVWSAGIHHEMHRHQEIRFSTSSDGLSWSANGRLVAEPETSHDIYQAGALYGCDDYVAAYCNTFIGSDADEEIRKKGGTAPRGVEIFVTTDGVAWERKGLIGGNLAIHESPRMTSKGRLVTTADRRSKEPLFLIFEKGPLSPPRVIEFPLPSADLPLHECTWYETGDGRLWMLFRDETVSLRLRLSVSEDGGETWSVPVLTNFVDSMSKVFAGRLSDGRVFVINNAYPQALNRDRLMLSVSRDGKVFDSMFILDDAPSRIRILGYLKNRGHAYPHALVHGGKLFVIYSTSKEDIRVAAVDLAALGRP
ncbi:MAG: exo-alpha-sialidase [Planctomycetota bacterium]